MTQRPSNPSSPEAPEAPDAGPRGVNIPVTESILAAIDQEIACLDGLAELSDQRYHETHDEFEAHSNQRALIVEWFERWADAALWPSKRRADVLSVGCGGGTMDLRIAEVFARHSHALGLAGVDPNPLHTKAFAECFADRAAEVTVATTVFEQYETAHHFDVIHFVHCLYYFEHLQPTIERGMRLLKPGGSLIFLLAPNGKLNALADRLWRKQWSRSAWYSEDVLPLLLRSIGGSVQHEQINARVDVARCLDPDDEVGRRVLDFIVQADTSRLSSRLQSLLRSYLDSIAASESGRRLAPHPVDAIAFQRDE